MVLRIEVAGVSMYEEPAAEDAAPAPPPEGLNFSTSSLVICPPRPVPLSWPMGMPFSRARFLAAGEILGARSREVSRRVPVDSDSWALIAGLEASSPPGGAFPEPDSGFSEDWDASSLGASFDKDLSPPASSIVKDSKAETSPPSSIKTAMGCKLFSRGIKEIARIAHVSHCNILLSGFFQDLG
jgi:hypothetical protein